VRTPLTFEHDPAVAKLQELLRIPTVSYADERADPAPFHAFLAAHERLFPRLHADLERTLLNGTAMLFHWPGRSSARPVVLMAHIDVVPVAEGDRWQHPPFAAEVVDGTLWGRGTLDDKGSLVAISEAVERLLEGGHVPAQDVWLSFGNDEEISGGGAPAAAAALRARGVAPWFVLDEGGAVAHDAFPGVSAPVAVVGVTEKGTTTVTLEVEGRGGHSSTPRRNDTTARLARAVVRLDDLSFPAALPAPTLELLRRLAPHAKAPMRQLLGAATKAPPVLTRLLTLAGPETAAMTRTTLAVTTLQGSPAHNVIASTARAGVNVRVMVGDTVAGVVQRMCRAIADDRVRVTVTEASEPSPVSAYDDDAFRLLESVIEECFPGAVPSPYVMMGATDSRFLTEICPRVYRYAPFRMTKAQRESIHSYDEHIGVEAFLEGVRWYQRLVERLPG
jgi:carboxypeptidase PM20D1